MAAKTMGNSNSIGDGTRAATHKGSWYSDDRQVLTRDLNTFLERARSQSAAEAQSPRAVIAPFVFFSNYLGWAFIFFREMR